VDELRQALAEAIASDGPELVEVTVAPGMSL
jgi:thiamine pyrophosphate-dependent acetolactate synthase large subunit-like protein